MPRMTGCSQTSHHTRKKHFAYSKVSFVASMLQCAPGCNDSMPSSLKEFQTLNFFSFLVGYVRERPW